MAKTVQNKLTPKQEMFCREYMVDLNATQAAIRAGYTMQNLEAGRYYVYFLINPVTDKIFYVGKGIRNRMYLHEKQVRRGVVDNPSKCKEIQKIISNGFSVRTECFAVCSNEKEAYEVESLLINLFSATGISNIAICTMSHEDKCKESAKIMLTRFREKSEYLAIFETQLPKSLKQAVIKVFGSAEKAYDKVYGAIKGIAHL